MSLSHIEVVVFGPSNSGKSNLVNFLTEKHPKFGEEPISCNTLIRTDKKKITLPNSEDEKVTLCYKQYQFSSFLPKSKNPKIALFCFDISNENSELLDSIKQYKENNPHDTIFLVGTKQDLNEKKEISENFKYMLQKTTGISTTIYTTSTKEKTGIDELKHAIQNALPDFTQQLIEHTKDNIKLALTYASKESQTEINGLLKQLDRCKTFTDKKIRIKTTIESLTVLAHVELTETLKNIDNTRKEYIINALKALKESKDQEEFESLSRKLIEDCKNLFKDHSKLNSFLKVLIAAVAAIAVYLMVYAPIAFLGVALGALFPPAAELFLSGGILFGLAIGVPFAGAVGGGLAHLFFKPSPQQIATELLDKTLALNTSKTIAKVGCF